MAKNTLRDSSPENTHHKNPANKLASAPPLHKIDAFQTAVPPDELQATLARLRLHLCTVLQTSLEIEKLLALFFQQLQELIGVAGVEFSCASNTEKILIGTHAIHKFSYQLSTGHSDVGDLTCYSRTRVSGINIEILEIAASTLVYPLHHALLFQQALAQAEADPLSGLGNRLALNKTLPKLVAGAHRHKHPLSLIILDIDRFKNINDEYGHIIGDRVIEAVGQTIKDITRSEDMSFRFGGEEFVVVMPNTASTGAVTTCERLRQAITEIKEQSTHLKLATKISASFGFAELYENEGTETLIKRADIALYQAKRTGRNCVVEG